MKKLLEVLQDGDGGIKFNTDIDVMKNPEQVLSITYSSAVAMMTTLWGGNEKSVIAVIRALAIADLAVSVNTEYMIRELKKSSELIKKNLQAAKKIIEKDGGEIHIFNPGIKPDKMKS